MLNMQRFAHAIKPPAWFTVRWSWQHVHSDQHSQEGLQLWIHRWQTWWHGGGGGGPLNWPDGEQKWNWLIDFYTETFTLLSEETEMIKHSTLLVILKAQGEWF